MHKTRNDLRDNTRKAVIEILQGRLADAVDLSTQAKQAHWNVRGPNFHALHLLFDQVTTEARAWSDTIAERIGELGGVAEGTARMAIKRSELKEYPLDIADGPDHVDALSSALASFGKRVRAAIDETDKIGDKDTADLFTEVSRGADHQLWLVEAHAQAKR